MADRRRKGRSIDDDDDDALGILEKRTRPSVVSFIRKKYQETRPNSIVEAFELGSVFVPLMAGPHDSPFCEEFELLRGKKLGGGVYGTVYEMEGKDYVVKSFRRAENTFHSYDVEVSPDQVKMLEKLPFSDLWRVVSNDLYNACANELHYNLGETTDCEILMFSSRIPADIVAGYNGMSINSKYDFEGGNSLRLNIPLFAFPCKREPNDLRHFLKFIHYHQQTIDKPRLVGDALVIPSNGRPYNQTIVLENDPGSYWAVKANQIYICEQDFFLEVALGAILQNIPNVTEVKGYQLCSYENYGKPDVKELLIMERMTGSCSDFVNAVLSTPEFSEEDMEEQILGMIIDIFLGLIDIQRLGVNHNDLSLKNALFAPLREPVQFIEDTFDFDYKKTSVFKITDFGLGAKYPLNENDFYLATTGVFRGYGGEHFVPNHFSFSYDVLYFLMGVRIVINRSGKKLRKIDELIRTALDDGEGFVKNFVYEKLENDPNPEVRNLLNYTFDKIPIGTILSLTFSRSSRPRQEIYGACEISANPENLLFSSIFNDFFR